MKAEKLAPKAFLKTLEEEGFELCEYDEYGSYLEFSFDRKGDILHFSICAADEKETYYIIQCGNGGKPKTESLRRKASEVCHAIKRYAEKESECRIRLALRRANVEFLTGVIPDLEAYESRCGKAFVFAMREEVEAAQKRAFSKAGEPGKERYFQIALSGYGIDTMMFASLLEDMGIAEFERKKTGEIAVFVCDIKRFSEIENETYKKRLCEELVRFGFDLTYSWRSRN